MKTMELYVSGIIPDNEWIINFIRFQLYDLFDRSDNITVSRRKNMRRRLEPLFEECSSDDESKYRVKYNSDKTPGVTELYRANDAYFVKADKALIFWDMADVYTIQEILLLLQRGIKVKLFFGSFNTPIKELNGIDDLLSVLPPRREGAKGYGEELKIPRQLVGACKDYLGADQYRFDVNHQPVGFSESELVHLAETTKRKMDSRKTIYEEIMSQTDVIHDLVELAQKGAFKMQSIKMTAWYKHQEIVDALYSLELKPNEYLLVFNNWGNVNMLFNDKSDMMAYLSHIYRWSSPDGKITIQKYVCCNPKEIFPPSERDWFSNKPVMILDTEYYCDDEKIYDFRKYTCSNGFSMDLYNKGGFRRANPFIINSNEEDEDII